MRCQVIDDYQRLEAKIKALNESVWSDRAPGPDVEKWLDNFTDGTFDLAKQRLHAMFLLSNFLFFGSAQVRELLKSMYRDLVCYPLVEEIRQANADTNDLGLIRSLYRTKLESTRFLAVGNPAESGAHLLYYFRQENFLHKDLFINTHQIFSSTSSATGRSLRDPSIERYIFIDDFCGSGTQGIKYSRDIVSEVRRSLPGVQVAYLVLFATTHGIEKIRAETEFDIVECVCELDSSFRCFADDSRFYVGAPPEIDRAFARDMCRAYGSKLVNPSHALGFADSQLLIGFIHNVPDNTLPVLWSEGSGVQHWFPVFRRYAKLGGA